MLKVVRLDKDTEEDYMKFVESHRDSLLFHTLKYRNLILKITNSLPEYLIACDDGEIKGVLPLMIKEGPYGKVINSLPYYGSNGGILSVCTTAKEMLMECYNQMVIKKEYISSVVVLNPFDPNLINNKFLNNEIDFRIGQITFLRSDYTDIEDLIIDFHTKTRNMIRKALKSDVKVKVENDQWEFLKRTHIENMRKINGKSKSDDFFKYSKDVFSAGKDYNIFVARKGNKIISALLVFYFGNTIEYYMPVIDQEYRSLQPLSLAISVAMLDGSSKGFEKWNWGGTWESQEGVYRFKSRWNTIDYKYHYMIYINKKEVYNCSIKLLESNYEGFYVVPYDKLIYEEDHKNE